MATIDNESEPGAWQREMDKLPWGYGQNQAVKIEAAISNIRTVGLWREADAIQLEIKTLQSELEYMRKELDSLKNSWIKDDQNVKLFD